MWEIDLRFAYGLPPGWQVREWCVPGGLPAHGRLVLSALERLVLKKQIQFKNVRCREVYNTDALILLVNFMLWSELSLSQSFQIETLLL